MSRQIFRWLHRRKMSRRHMRGGWLHGWFGDHLFNRHLWVLERDGIARALFWGFLVCFSPFFGLHFLLGAAAAMCFRANIPLTLVVQCITNPATIILYYPAAYVLGARILGQPELHRNRLMEVLQNGAWSERLDLLGDIGLPLFLGCFLVGISMGTAGWFLVRLFWRTPPATPP